MALPGVSRRFALLVGVDFYPDHKVRRFEDGTPVSLRSLEGAVNDVKNVETLLRNRFRFDSVCVLTSSASPIYPGIPNEPEHSWPTYTNIKREFDRICCETGPGDVFFFHFSGHGAPLATTTGSPKDRRQSDPSLMTADYCCGQPAIRGWELNEWLLKFNTKGIRVIVLLDSCYSAGAWRVACQFRCPDHWPSPAPNLPVDGAALQRIQRQPGNRDGRQTVGWDLNPDGFTLMAACQSNQLAAEKSEQGLVHGAFTLAFMDYFQNTPDPLALAYHAIHDYTTELLASWGLPQEPQFYGQDRLAFLEDYEPISITTIFGTLKDGIISLPVGKIHGVSKGAEFITVSRGPKITVSISETHGLESEATVTRGHVQDLSQSIRLIPYRWRSEKTLHIVIDPKLGQSFRENLTKHLQHRIASDIQYTDEVKATKNEDTKVSFLWSGLLFPKIILSRLGDWIYGGSEATWFQLGLKGDGGIEIFGSEQILGGQGPVRGWNTRGETEDERARESAIALAHLFRFEQILRLRDESEDAAPFQATLKPTGKHAGELQFKIKNKGAEKLYFAVLILSPGFHVKQLFPAQHTLDTVRRHEEQSFEFTLTAPDQLKYEANGQQHKCRDIIRTIVTKGQKISLKSLEMPDIWNADQWDDKRVSDSTRDGMLVEKGKSFHWWIHDEQRFTNVSTRPYPV